MASARLSKYIVESPSDAVEESVLPASAADAAAVASAAAHAAAAASTTAQPPFQSPNASSSCPGRPEGKNLPRTGSHCLKEGFHRSNVDENDDEVEEGEEFDLDFQTSDASLIAASKSSKTVLKANIHKSYNKLKTPVIPVTQARKYEPYQDEDDDRDDHDEWATVEIRDATTGDVGVPGSPLDPLSIPSSQPTQNDDDASVSYASVISAFRRCESVSAHLVNSKPSPSDSAVGCGVFLRRLGFPGAGAPPLDAESASTRDFLFCLAATPFDDENPLHPRILKSIYRHLRPKDFTRMSAVKRFGKHWENVGFQGVDPATDLRGVGLLGLTCLLNWFVDENGALVARKIYELSVDAVQNFPFAVMSINVTRMCLQELRRENLNGEILRRRSRLSKRDGDNDDACLTTFASFYRSLFYRLYVDWRDGGKTISDSGFVLKVLDKKWAKNPSKCIKEFDAKEKNVLVSKSKPKSKEPKRAKQSAEKLQTFTNISDL